MTFFAAVSVVLLMIGLSYGKTALVRSDWFDLNVRRRLSRQ